MQYPAKYPVGIQDFGKIRQEGYVYVDKMRSCGCFFTMLLPLYAHKDKFRAGTLLDCGS